MEPALPATQTQLRLDALQGRFTTFEHQMKTDKKVRRDADDNKVSLVRDSMSKLEKTLNSEIKRRVEANKALQNMFENQIATVQDKLEAVFCDRLDQLQSAVDSLNDRMSLVERDFTIEREKYVRNIEEKNAAVAKEATALQNAFENEKESRAEREQNISKRIADHEYRTEGLFEQERTAREQKYAQIREELDEVKRLRERGDEKFQTFILEEVATLKNGLVLETQTREQADDDIVQALNHYTKALQDALLIVNQTWYYIFHRQAYPIHNDKLHDLQKKRHCFWNSLTLSK